MGEIFSIQKVVRFQENLSQATLSNWIIFRIKLIESVESVAIGVNVKHINRQVITAEIHALEHLSQCHLLASPINGHNFIGIIL